MQSSFSSLDKNRHKTNKVVIRRNISWRSNSYTNKQRNLINENNEQLHKPAGWCTVAVAIHGRLVKSLCFSQTDIKYHTYSLRLCLWNKNISTSFLHFTLSCFTANKILPLMITKYIFIIIKQNSSFYYCKKFPHQF